MGTDKANIDDLIRIIDGNHEPIVIAPKVEDNPVIGDDTGCGIHLPNVVWRRPGGALRVVIPSLECLLSLGIAFPERTQGFAGNNAHSTLYHDPIVGSSDVLR